MKKHLLVITLAIIAGLTAAHAASGIFGTGVVLNLNNAGSSTLYEATLLGDSRQAPIGQTPAPTLNTGGFSSLNLGTFDTSLGNSLVFKGGGVLTYKNGTDNITGANVVYRIDSGSFTSYGLAFNQDNVNGATGDQRWYSQAASVNLLTGLSNGAHTVSFYFTAPFTYFGGNGTHVENNGTANYVAAFTVVPEPATWALLAGGLASLMVFRRRRIS